MPIVPFSQFFRTADGRNNPFDYLIVGGGTAGLVIAHRLTSNENITVGIIEAGAYHGPSGSVPVIDTPGLIGHTLHNLSYDWAFRSVPQPHANGRIIPLARGKGLGGSTLINYLTLTRPSRHEYDVLEIVYRNQGWNWDAMLRCMKQSESCLQFDEGQGAEAPHNSYVARLDKSAHGTQGPIHHSYSPTWPPNTSNLTDPLFQAFDHLGVPANEEPYNGNNIGYCKPLLTVDPITRIRSSSVSGYLDPILNNRNNLLCVTGAIVTRILFDEHSPSVEPRAIGVEVYLPEDQSYHVIRNVRREIILSAGTFKTPQILECSGIGNPAVLKEHGIGCLVDLPGVGENLQDHFSVGVIAEVGPQHVTAEVLLNPEELEKQQTLYQEKKEGMFAKTPGQGLAFLSLDLVSKVTNSISEHDTLRTLVGRLDVENEKYLDMLNLPLPLRRGQEIQYKVQKAWLSDPAQAQLEIISFLGYLSAKGVMPPDPNNSGKNKYMTLVASIMHPFSRGSVHIAPGSGDFTAKGGPPDPTINPNLLSHPLDRELLLQGLEYIIHLNNSEPLKSAVKEYADPKELNRTGIDLSSDSGVERARIREVLETYMQNYARTIYHPVGTAAMMPREDGGVVDSQLRVYGVSGLRVADLSVLPHEISSHTASAAFAIGEMASEILLRRDQNHRE